MKQCPRCLFTEDIAVIGEYQCNYCDLHDELERKASGDLETELSKIRNPHKKYDCIMGISGGLDSSTLLYLAVMHWHLKPLVIHFDNRWNNTQAENNMKNLCERLNVDSIVYRVNKREYDELNHSFLRAGTPDADIPNDIAMTKLMYQAAAQYKIKWILNGHDFRTEGSTPAKWTYMDARYIQDVYTRFTAKELINYPLFTFTDQIRYALKGIKQIRPFHYGIDRKFYESQMKQFIQWQDYGAKHSENIYTEYVGAEYLPHKFGIDKRIVYLSARVRSGDLLKQEAQLIYDTKSFFDLSKLGDKSEMIQHNAKSKIVDRKEYKHYNFKKYRFLIWLLMKMKVVPYTMYVKYAKN